MYNTILACVGLLAVASAQPVTSRGKCINGMREFKINFNNLHASTNNSVSRPPVPYGGLDFDGWRVIKLPTTEVDGNIIPFRRASGNAIEIHSKKHAGYIYTTGPGGRSNTFYLKSFDAACYIPNDDGNDKAVDCKIGNLQTNGDATSTATYEYKVPKDGIGSFITFHAKDTLSSANAISILEGPKGAKLAFDDLVAEEYCQ